MIDCWNSRTDAAYDLVGDDDVNYKLAEQAQKRYYVFDCLFRFVIARLAGGA